MVAGLTAELNNDGLPIQVVAVLDGAVVGTAAPSCTSCATASPGFALLARWRLRVGWSAQQGIAGALVRHVEKLAVDRHRRALHLQTERLDGGPLTRKRASSLWCRSSPRPARAGHGQKRRPARISHPYAICTRRHLATKD